ncbi:hypothetical protein FHU38_000799 [Saccharomonospora amisosensis]|uniref:Glycosyltransferase involved in cell wall biogenesis n=1 Tax=Saccharomonospora amisosensis TaxID=1128677 RepID=A0A7X5ULZ6_9PSEU|nr:DUF2064 domain-containing protein [Saccharomonospora amisosensis]NIJ10455.1 hypothetical protein [Saccharomonospora amisosensis]
MNDAWCALVVAKAPVPGQAKTRLCPPATPWQAADLAAAALLDTLDAALKAPAAVPVVALAGQLASAARRGELSGLLRRCTVLAQRGPDLGARLANAHADVARLWPGLPVVQVGMDTPQLTPALLRSVADDLRTHEAVLGPAFDGGWWVLALREPTRACVLAGVPMSQPDTAALTRRALAATGLPVTRTDPLCDVDTMADAVRVAELIPDSRFAAAVRAIRTGAASR